jgi:hypothetical protein
MLTHRPGRIGDRDHHGRGAARPEPPFPFLFPSFVCFEPFRARRGLIDKWTLRMTGSK